MNSTTPDTTITSSPPSITSATSADFSFSSSQPASTFECLLDAAAFSPCSSPQSYSGLADGAHSFQVRATDPAGNVDLLPASYSWTVDTTAPPPNLITNVVVSNGNLYRTGSLAAGEKVYSDRSYTFTSAPAAYFGQEYIVTANNDKTATAPDFLTFTLSAAATVYVLFDDRASALPAWLDDGSWTPSNDTIGTTDVTRRLYMKAFTAGTVQLGGNAMAPMSGAGSNYNVVAIQ